MRSTATVNYTLLPIECEALVDAMRFLREYYGLTKRRLYLYFAVFGGQKMVEIHTLSTHVWRWEHTWSRRPRAGVIDCWEANPSPWVETREYWWIRCVGGGNGASNSAWRGKMGADEGRCDVLCLCVCVFSLLWPVVRDGVCTDVGKSNRYRPGRSTSRHKPDITLKNITKIL